MDKEKVLNGEWSLAELYAGYEDPRFTADVTEMDRLITRMDEQSKDLTGEPKELLPRLLETQHRPAYHHRRLHPRNRRVRGEPRQLHGAGIHRQAETP